MMRKVRTRVWSTLIAVAMLLAMLPTVALAADLPTAGNDSITLTDGVYELSGDTQLSVPIQVTGNVTLDLAGYTLSPVSEYSASYLIKVSEGGNLTLTDSGATGKITTNDNDGIRGISNNGTFTMDSGAIEVYSYAVENVVTQRSYENNQPVICNITGGELTASYAWTVLFMGAGMAGQSSEGKSSIHTGEEGSVRNDLIQVNISGDAKITGDQALTTNASNGIYAGFTLNISENAEISGSSNTDNCAIYLPAVGETTISGGTISGDQGIRIAAGELNITGGTIEGTKVSNEKDLIAGGSGGTMGAIVVGKAGGGYIGDVLVNVEEKATVKNVATEDGDKAAIIVSDKFMGDASKGYDALSITVNVNGATVEGNVVKVSNVNPGTTADGGSTTLALNGATVTGSVINQTKDGDLDITGGTVTGSVTNDSAGSVTVSGSSVAGNVENKSTGDVVIQESATVTGSVTNTGDGTNKGAVAIINSKVGAASTTDTSITVVNSYIGESETPTTNTGDNEARIGATSYATLAEAITHVQAGETITLLKDITVQRGTADASVGVYQLPAGVTLDGNGKTLTADSENWGAVSGGSTATHILSVINNDETNELVTTIKDLNVVGHARTKAGVLAFGPGAKVALENVDIQNCGTVGVQVNSATVTAENLKTSGNAWGGVNLDVGSGQTSAPDFTLSGDDCDLQEANAIYSECKDNDVEANIMVTATGFTAVVIEGDPAEVRYTTNVGSLVEALNAAAGGSTQISVDDFVADVDGTWYTDFDTALAAVTTGSTITLLQNVTVSDKIVIDDANVTLDGDGHSITVSTNADFVGPNQTPPVNSVLEVLANNVTIQDVELIGTAGKTKHGVQFYNVEGGKLSGVTVTDTAWTGVLVNASEVTIENSVLNPTGDGVYATIEYAMGNDTLTRIPTLHLNNVSSDSGITVWADNDTVTRVITRSAEADTAAEAAEEIRNSITTENNVAITVSIDVNNDDDNPVDTTVPSTKPSNGSSGVTRYNITIEDMENGDVTSSHSRASRGTTVTLTINPDDGYELDELIVTDANGDEIDLTRKSSTKYTFEMPRSRVTVDATFVEGEIVSTLPFDDVDVDDWFYDAVEYAYENDLMNGVSDDEFDPNGTLTRGMMVTVLYRLEGEPESRADLPFEDVEPGTWYTEAVRWAVDEGIVLGTSDTTYEPDAMITREQLATMLYRYAAYKDYDTTQGGMAIREFEDYEEISDWALEGLDWAVNAELVNGVGNNTIAPLSSATRAETATLLMRFIEAFEA